jgi:hypothetical protein
MSKVKYLEVKDILSAEEHNVFRRSVAKSSFWSMLAAGFSCAVAVAMAINLWLP